MTPREEFHRFIDEMEGDLANLAKSAFHGAIDDLEDGWVSIGLNRMRVLCRHLTDPLACRYKKIDAVETTHCRRSAG
jgi:hypothetical protein